MLWPIALGTFLLATSLSALPLDPDAEILPSAENEPTLATDLMPPPLLKDGESEKKPVLFLINLFGVKNETGDEEVLQDDILSELPEISAPLASILLVVEADDEDTAVSLEEVSKDLENEGFKVETIKGKDGEIKAVKVDINLDDLEASSEEKKDDESEISRVLRKKRETGQSGIERIRRKRHLCLKCKLNDLHEKLHGGHGGYGGGGCGNGNCGGGYGGGYGGQGNTIGVIPVAVVPVNSGYGGYGGQQGGYQGGYHQGHQNGGCNTCGGGYQPPPPPPPPRPVCNTCGGGGYPQGGGGGGYSHASAHAEASASAQASSY